MIRIFVHPRFFHSFKQSRPCRNFRKFYTELLNQTIMFSGSGSSQFHCLFHILIRIPILDFPYLIGSHNVEISQTFQIRVSNNHISVLSSHALRISLKENLFWDKWKKKVVAISKRPAREIPPLFVHQNQRSIFRILDWKMVNFLVTSKHSPSLLVAPNSTREIQFYF